MAGKRLELSDTGIAVADNVERLIRSTGLNHTQLSARLALIGRDIPPLAVGRIIKKERRVDADDLVALAIALGVTPITLLMPATGADDEDAQVTLTGVGKPISAVSAWNWLSGQAPEWFSGSVTQYVSLAWPRWLQDKFGPVLHQVACLPRGATDGS